MWLNKNLRMYFLGILLSISISSFEILIMSVFFHIASNLQLLSFEGLRDVLGIILVNFILIIIFRRQYWDD